MFVSPFVRHPGGESRVDERSLELIEFPHVAAAVAERAASDGARVALARWRPLPGREERAREHALLAEAMRRTGEPGAWCSIGPGVLHATLIGEPVPALDGPALVAVLRWLEAGEATYIAWRDEGMRSRFPLLAGLADAASSPRGLRESLARALDPDGKVKDSASAALGRLRREVSDAERRLGDQLERWARGFGPDAYVTRHGDRFVAMVPGAGFPRRRGIVHDTSNSGQSLLVEPLESCGENNRLMELRGAALDEERRILRELAAAVQVAAPELERLERALVHLDTLRARALWGRELGAVAIAPQGQRLRLIKARHPLLAMRERRDPLSPVVPLDLDLGGGAGRVLLVSGPNMGGKTVVLKTVGLALALSHAAFPVPAEEGSEIPEMDILLVDLGDAQSLEQGLSTFAAHLSVLARMVESAGPRTWLLCDELGAGTDPEEGAALARALVEHVAERGAWGVMTTHLGSLKRLSGDVAGVVHGSLEFDLDTLTPRYRFLAGVPGSSHALAVAERLGFPAPVLARARMLIPESARTLERLTVELAEARVQAAAEASALSRAREEAESAAREYRDAREVAGREAIDLRRRVTRESEALLARVRELWQTVQRESRREHKTRAAAESMGQEIGDLEGAVDALRPNPEAGTAPLAPEALVPGLRVRVIDLGIEAEIVSAPDEEGRVRLRRGDWTIQSQVGRLAACDDARRTSASRVNATWSVSDDALGLEVDLRGMDAEEAVRALDHGLDRAMVAGLSELRVVHGIGRGVLRAMVERHLRGHPQVAGQRLGAVGEGGRGVTVVRLC